MTDAVIRVGGYAPAGAVHSRALDRFADFVRQESNGDVRVDVLYNVMDTGRPMADLLDMVIDGELTWCYFSTSYLGATVPTVDALEIPFLFATLDDAHTALDGAFGAALATAIARPHPIEVLGYWDNGFRHLTNRRGPIRTPSDCAGLSIRLQPNRVHAQLVEAWGMTPVLAELSEGIRMIADGDVDAQENPLANTRAYGVDHRHITLTAHLYGARGLLASRAQMDELDAETADLVRRGARVAIEYQRDAARRYEIELRGEFEAEGRRVIELTLSERTAFVDASASVVATARAAVPDALLALLA
jgi:TRAP-type C4-dicarboxylate transport system substrate-binding protein